MPSETARQLHFARNLRRNATQAERTLWRMLGSYRPRFTRQLPIGPYVADFACRRARLIVELDGGQHVDNPHDTIRTAALESTGWRVVRFWNTDVVTNCAGVIEAILEAGNPRLPPGETFETAAPRTRRKEKEEGHP